MTDQEYWEYLGLEPDSELRKTLKAADLNKMDDGDFAYVDSNGDRHLPIHDEAHVRAALARFSQTQFDTPADKAAAAKKIVAKAKSFGIDVDPGSPVGEAAGLKESKSARAFQPAPYDADGEGKGEPVTCPSCGKGDAADAVFCDQCGFRLGGADGVIVNGKQTNDASTETEVRDDPTPEDDEVAALLSQAQDILNKLEAVQEKDPDNGTDPDDAKVLAGIKTAQSTIAQTISDQAKDGAPEHKSRRKPRHRSAKLAPEFRRGIGREIRLYGANGLEVRDAPSVYGSSAVEVVGAPIVYNAPYSVRDLFGEFEETMMPGVAASVLADADCRFLVNHDGLPLARTLSGTLALNDTPEALNFSAILDSRSSVANDLVVAIQRGDVSQMSCGFVVADDTWSEDWTQRSIYRFDELLDVSAVTYPASPTTSIDIANRMMMEVPVESRARIQKFWSFAATEIRAGKVLSDENAAHIKNAASALQAVLDNANVDGSNDGKVTSKTEDDGTVAGNTPDAATANDGTGARGRATAAELRLELDLVKARRRAA